MADSVQIAAFVGGELRLKGSEEASSEAVLALPLSRLLVKLVRVPAENREDPVAFATPILAAMSPYPDEGLTVSCEAIADDGEGGSLTVLAAALPESAAEDIGSALDAAKLNPKRIDILELGWIRELWAKIDDGRADIRRAVLLKDVDCISLFVLDNGVPVALRAISASEALKRELMLTLLEAEDFGGAKNLEEIVIVGDMDESAIAEFAPVRRIAVATTTDADGNQVPVVEGIGGVSDRAVEAGTLDALPASWREVLEESRFKAKLVKGLSIAGGIWLLVMAVLFGVPIVFGFMTDHQRALCQEHKKKFQIVSETKNKVELIQKYSDRDRGALEILKLVSDRLPSGATLTGWNFKRGESVRFTVEADSDTIIYDFKDALANAAVIYRSEPEEGADPESAGDETREPIFDEVKPASPKNVKGRWTSEIVCLWLSDEEKQLRESL